MKKIIAWFILLLPIVYLILLSFHSYYKFPAVIPKTFTWLYWSDVIVKNSLFYRGLLSSLIIGFMTACLSTLIGFMTGRAVVYHLKGFTKTIAIIIAIPLMIPGMIMFLGMHQILIYTPFINSIIGVVIAHTVICIPYTSNIAIAYFAGIPKEFEEVSKTLGGTGIITLKKVILPLILPGILMSMSISFLISNTEYFSTFLIGGGKVISLSMLMFPYIINADYGHTAVMGLIFIGVHSLLFLGVQILIKNRQNKVFYGGD